MRKGTVKWFSAKKGYGFIVDENGNDVFVHYSAIKADGFRALKMDDTVTYDITTDESGKEYAATVEVVK